MTEDMGQPMDEATQLVSVSQSHPSTDQAPATLPEQHGHLTPAQTPLGGQHAPPMMHSLSGGMDPNPGAHPTIQGDPNMMQSMLDPDQGTGLSLHIQQLTPSASLERSLLCSPFTHPIPSPSHILGGRCHLDSCPSASHC